MLYDEDAEQFRGQIYSDDPAGRKRGVDQARASFRLEGIHPPPEVEALSAWYVAGEIS